MSVDLELTSLECAWIYLNRHLRKGVEKGVEKGVKQRGPYKCTDDIGKVVSLGPSKIRKLLENFTEAGKY
jgi:hypothetical protein